MYRREYGGQMRLDEFILPFDGKLDSNNRWVKLCEIIPWEKIEEYYLLTMKEENGRGAMSARIAFGAIYIKQSEKLSDEATVTYIRENPYMQYFLGLKEYQKDALFDSSMMVHFRKRFPVEFVAKVNEYICTGIWPKEGRNVDRNDHHDDDDKSDRGSSGGKDADKNNIEEPKDTAVSEMPNKGTLIMDATVAPADIKYPTDIDLLNQCRENLEKAIDLLWPEVEHKCHKYPYSQKKARKAYLNLAKSKKLAGKKLREGIKKQLDCVASVQERLKEMEVTVTDWENRIPGWLKERLDVGEKVYAQQKEMYDEKKHECENRIVSLMQPHVRPIVRGKRPNPTEFGQKLHLSVVDGYTYIEQTCWNAYNEGCDLKAVTEDYRRKFGFYPVAILADKIYQTRENRAYCKAGGIRLSGPALGRPKKEKDQIEAQKQMYRDACDRNAVESRNGNLKRKYGLDLIMSKLDETAKTEAGMDILVMNAWRKIKGVLLHFFRISFRNERFLLVLAPTYIFQ